MNGIDLDRIVRKPKRTVLVCWRDADGTTHSEPRPVLFEKGLGPYIRWNKRAIPVDLTQTKIDVKMPGPRPR